MIDQGCKPDKLNIVFKSAAEKIEEKLIMRKDGIKIISSLKRKEERLFFHLQYHPQDVSRQQIRNWYEHTCENPNDKGEIFKFLTTNKDERFNIDILTIAYHMFKTCVTISVLQTLENALR